MALLSTAQGWGSPGGAGRSGLCDSKARGRCAWKEASSPDGGLPGGGGSHHAAPRQTRPLPSCPSPRRGGPALVFAVASKARRGGRTRVARGLFRAAAGWGGWPGVCRPRRLPGPHPPGSGQGRQGHAWSLSRDWKLSEHVCAWRTAVLSVQGRSLSFPSGSSKRQSTAPAAVKRVRLVAVRCSCRRLPASSSAGSTSS